MNVKSFTPESANQSFYDADSGSYDDGRWLTKGGAVTNQAQQLILNILSDGWVGKRVLEVGSGTARFTIPLLRKGNQMTLADISSGMLAVAKKNIEAAGLESQVDSFNECSIYDLPFDENCFDHAISLNVLNHLEHPEDALKQLSRVIRPGSTILFNYANLNSYFWPAAWRINKRNKAHGVDVFSSWVKPCDMRENIKNAGLELVSVLGNVHMPRGLERYPVRSVVRALDMISRRGPLARLAPFHFCLCRKPL